MSRIASHFGQRAQCNVFVQGVEECVARFVELRQFPKGVPEE
jgi:hypothetical protein